jgi:Zn-dependent metalloprotease
MHIGEPRKHDYWTSVHGRNSFDNAGAAIKVTFTSSNYDNAYWNGSVMTYGDGSGTYFDILTSIDVAAHEIGHAICSNTANLAYQPESGAMNEAFSDIWSLC